MKSLGIVRKIDELGRIVLPVETRKKLNIASGDGVEIFVEKDRVILKKYEPACIFCGDSAELVDFNDKKVCKKCIEALNNASL
ncbi:MAG: AbrB/MazE/SpoVT family DNA-binding domain-containing protein [Clostridia bacterium]|nr:AbrB/MazE/SpoVT family DNA-binding domain-containing protein [Clostridia bacterium]